MAWRRSWAILLLLFVLLQLSFTQEDDFERYRNIYEEEPEEVELHVDEIADWIGEDPEKPKREELHAVGMCWQSEMARCVNDCTNSTSKMELLQEICASYCQADVTYMCTKINLDYGGKEIFKFGGRWPFNRVWIFTEFGSVLFCSLSVILHMYWLFQYITVTDSVMYKTKSSEGVYPYRFLWISMHSFWAITFLCAIAFHTVDIQITEYLDYFTAMASSLFGLWSALIRIFEVKKSSRMWLLATPIVGFYGFHLMRMTTLRFAYGYNMRATITLIVIQASLWTVWSLLNYKKAPYVKWKLAGYILLAIFVPLEVIDAPPVLFMFDMHAFWHLSLTLIFACWQQFYIQDTLNYRPVIAKSE